MYMKWRTKTICWSLPTISKNSTTTCSNRTKNGLRCCNKKFNPWNNCHRSNSTKTSSQANDLSHINLRTFFSKKSTTSRRRLRQNYQYSRKILNE